MAIERYCCCALSCKQLPDPAPKNAGNDSSFTPAAGGQAPDTQRAKSPQTNHIFSALTGTENRKKAETEKQRNEQATEFERLLSVRHKNDAQFAPLYVEKVERIFPSLQAALQATSERACSSTTENSHRNAWHSYFLAGCLGALEFYSTRSPQSTGRITADSWDEWAREVQVKLPRVSLKATVSGDLPLVRRNIHMCILPCGADV